MRGGISCRKYRLREARSKQLRYDAGHSTSVGLAEKLYEIQGGLCACCGVPLNGVYHEDHIMPFKLKGIDEDSNIQLLLPKCNSEKSAKHPIKFMRDRRADYMLTWARLLLARKDPLKLWSDTQPKHTKRPKAVGKKIDAVFAAELAAELEK